MSTGGEWIVKCIYCNDEENLTISDIIPAALTGAKLRKKFVCQVHNSFTNDYYEKAMIRQLDIFRNRIGLTERNGDPVRYFANLTIGEYTSQKNIIVTDNSSIMDSDRLFRMEDKQGNTVLVGPKNKLLKINRVEPNKIIDLPLEDISISSKADIRDLFISETVLHAVAKIAYEWHCYINDVEEFQEETYGMITSYILNPEQENTLVNIVNDDYVKEVADRFSRTGSNMLFEYYDPNGNIYVIFCLWNVITYKVKICAHNKKPSMIHYPIAYFYHSDGSQNGVMFGVYGNFHVNATSPNVGISELYSEIKFRLSRLGERDLSKEYLQNFIARISKKLLAYKEHKISIADLLDFEHEDRIMPIYILEQIYIHRDEYLSSEDFYVNMQRILRVDDRFVFTKETKKEIVKRYINMDYNGSFATMLNKAIEFFEIICNTESNS